MNDLKINATAISIDPESLRQLLDRAVEDNILSAVTNLGNDNAWLEKIETLVNQAVVQRTLAKLGSIDIASIVKERVDENMKLFRQELLSNFASTGIDDRATDTQLTVMDDHTVVENKFTAREIESMGSVVTRDLVVKGSINVDNASWDVLANEISAKTLRQIDEEFKEQLIDQVRSRIKSSGIDFDEITMGGRYLVKDGELSAEVTKSNLQELGKLKTVKVESTSEFNNTLKVLRGRVGVNTEEPEAALSVWDEEVSITINKYKNQEAYIGTSRSQALNIGVNKDPQVIIGADGVTAIKKLRVAQYRLGHSDEVPNWSGTRGDVMFNSLPTPDNAVFAWVCLGGYKWKVVRALS